MVAGRFNDAVRTCTRLLQEAGGADAEGYLARGLSWFHLGNPEEAYPQRQGEVAVTVVEEGVLEPCAWVIGSTFAFGSIIA